MTDDAGGQAQTCKRALVFAGGGAKVAYQAGVLQVWLDEAGIDFDYADAASGGTLNLAMWCSGLTGHEIAERWRQRRALRSATLRWPGWLIRPFTPGLMTEVGPKRMFSDFSLNFAEINSFGKEVRFNVWNMSDQRLVPLPAPELNPTLLTAALSLPMWWGPVRFEGKWWTDSVFATDANIDWLIDETDVKEIWVVWTVSTAGTFRPGFVGEYFQMIENAANSRLNAALHRIKTHNDSVDESAKIAVRILAPRQVPLHYLLTVRRSRFEAAVDLGVRDARRWCRERDIPLNYVASPPAPTGPSEHASHVSGLTFNESMSGELYYDGSLPETQRGQGIPFALKLSVYIPDLPAFMKDPDRAAQLSGHVHSKSFGRRRLIERGAVVNLLVDGKEGDSEKLMKYHLEFRDPNGELYRLVGVKHVAGPKSRGRWVDTTTLASELFHIDEVPIAGGSLGSRVAYGELRLSKLGFARELTTFRAVAPSLGRRISTVFRYGDFFMSGVNQAFRSARLDERLAPWLKQAVDNGDEHACQ